MIGMGRHLIYLIVNISFNFMQRTMANLKFYSSTARIGGRVVVAFFFALQDPRRGEKTQLRFPDRENEVPMNRYERSR